jgi:hypothetical protein
MSSSPATSEQKSLALQFAHHLVNGNYNDAYAMLSQNVQNRISIENLQADFERMIDAEWGNVDPVEILENHNYDFIYIVLGGEIYSEAIFINAWVIESENYKIDNFEFGRP